MSERVSLWELSDRAVACPRFRWLPGMLCWGRGERYPDFSAIPVERWKPCLSDPTTAGALLHVVRLARDDFFGFVAFDSINGWRYITGSAALEPITGASEMECLVKALEMAP